MFLGNSFIDTCNRYNIKYSMAIQTPADYHLRTAYERFLMDGHSLDWSNQPDVYKNYPGIQAVSLPLNKEVAEVDFWRTFASLKETIPGGPLDINLLAQVLALASGLTSKARYSGQEVYYRSVASAGALYPNEIYIAAINVEGLKAGLYHYRIRERDLIPLRLSPVGGYISRAVEMLQQNEMAVFVFITGIFFRSAWKYRERAYRYVLLDAGHLLENLLMILNATRLACSFTYNFNDENVASLLSIDSNRETCFACIGIQGKDKESSEKYEPVYQLSGQVPFEAPVEKREIVYNDILEIHRAGSMTSLPGKHYYSPDHDIGMGNIEWMSIPGDFRGERENGLFTTIVSRRSKRNFINRKLSNNDFTDLLNLLCHTYALTSGNELYGLPVRIGFIAGSIEGVEPGFYLLDHRQRKTGIINSGKFTGTMASVCLDQLWLSNASVHFLFIANLEYINRMYGARGYRYAMLTAGRLGHILYLGATALGIGCCGIGAFYDHEAKELLCLGKSSFLLYLVGVGRVKQK